MSEIVIARTSRLPDLGPAPELAATAWLNTDEGFVLIGNHHPEFSLERDLDGRRQAVAREGIEYPISQDNEAAAWNSYRTEYWPTLYLIDKRGRIRYGHIGEGAYEATERNIRLLLEEAYP